MADRKISVIIPAYNEKDQIGKCLKALKASDESLEVIVADGKSTDSTGEIAKAYGAVTVSSHRGRGLQMDVGAEMATGDILLFLHTDTILPDQWYDIILRALSDEKISGGAFSFSTDGSGLKYRVLEKLVGARNRFLGLTYGDQAIFVRKKVFHNIDGYKGLPIMEDIDMVSRLRKKGGFILLSEKAVTSSRRWEKKGFFKNSLRNLFFILLYFMGLNPDTIYRLYYK